MKGRRGRVDGVRLLALIVGAMKASLSVCILGEFKIEEYYSAVPEGKVSPAC